MDKLKTILSDWKGWASVLAILLLIATALSARLRKIVTKVLVEYLAANWRRFWYWVTNRHFWVSGRINFTFPANLSTDQKLIDEFSNVLRKVGEPRFEGSLSHGKIKLELTKTKDVLELSADTGQTLATLYEGADGYIDNANSPKAETDMNIGWEGIVVGYRDFHDIMDYLRQTIEHIRNGFAPLVSNNLNKKQNVYLRVFFERDQKVDDSVKQKIPVPGETVIIERMQGATDFGATSFDSIISYLPRYLVQETISDLMKKHNLTS